MAQVEDLSSRLFKIRRAVMQMLRDRNYLVVDRDLNMTKTEFIQKFGESVNCDDLIFNKAKDVLEFMLQKDMGAAQQVFDENSCTLDVVSWTTMITGYSNCGEMDRARWFFDRMPSRNLSSWNAMIARYACSGFAMHARYLFDEMPERNVVSWNTLINEYASIGQVELARQLFDEMPERDSVTYNALLMGYCKEGFHIDAMELFMEMRTLELKTSQSTFSGVLTAGTGLGEL